MAGRIGLAVAGTHGKTTTTSMLTVAMHACGRDPSYAIGGDLNEPGSNAHHGSGEFFVAEADESDRSFLLLSPQGAVITNVEPDHLDNYGDAAAVHGAFAAFVGRIDSDGVVLLGADDAGSSQLGAAGARARAAGPDLRSFRDRRCPDRRARAGRAADPRSTWSPKAVGSAGCSSPSPAPTTRSTPPARSVSGWRWTCRSATWRGVSPASPESVVGSSSKG